MGSLTVDLSKLKPSLLLSKKSKQKILKDTARRNCPEFGKRHRARVRAEGSRHFKATVAAVAGVLSRGGGPAASTRKDNTVSAPVSRRVRFKDAEGKSRYITTVPWEPLTEKYARASPVSTQFWHKLGIAEKLMLRRVSQAHITVRQGPGGGRIKASGDKFVCRSVARIGAERLPFPLGKVITDSFIGGKRVRQSVPGSTKGLDRNGYDRFLFPERDRPFIGDLAARMGQYFLTSLRKLK